MTRPGEFTDETVAIIWQRDEGRCVDCGKPLRRERRAEQLDGYSVQHREARGAGGTKRRGRVPSRPWLTLASNGALMCGDGVTGCHGRAETKDRRRATELGYVVRTGIRRPSEVPILHAVHGWVLLLNEAPWFEPVDAPESTVVAVSGLLAVVVNVDAPQLDAVGELPDLPGDSSECIGEGIHVLPQPLESDWRLGGAAVRGGGAVERGHDRVEVDRSVFGVAARDDEGRRVLGAEDNEGLVRHGAEATAPDGTPIVALDLFAGTGWGVALQARGIREFGVEIMDEARASRAAAGMETPYRDVWDVLFRAPSDSALFKAALEFASPPCQSFSVAGKGAGRAALDDVLRAIDEGAYREPLRLRDLAVKTDERTALVLTPLAQVYRDRPMLIAWEQVVPVLPVWQACAAVLEALGYSVWTGIMRAEQYGVPQARRRAVLIARRDGVAAAMPTPTHSRFYEREPERLDPGVLPWVSMADALGWGLSERPSPTITGGGTETGGAEPIAKLARYTSRPDWVFRRPATTIVADPRLGGPGRSEFVKGGVSRQNRPGSLRLEAHEAATLQTYPKGFHFAGGLGKQFLQIGNAVPPLMAGAIVDELVSPAALRAVALGVAA